MRTLAGLLMLSAMASCGGGDGSCSGGAPCGGEVNPGRYRVASFCSSITGTVKSDFCAAGITVQAGSFSASGTITFNADKTYQSDTTVGGSLVETIPAACLSQGGVQLTCAQLGQALQGPGSPSKGSCSGTSDCTCTLKFEPQPTMTTGTYATAGTTLTTTPSGDSPSQSQYCATPTSLTLIADTRSMLGMMSPEMAEMVTGRSAMVLTKE
jgi:hypothetical protein